jgi:hypothetical protein
MEAAMRHCRYSIYPRSKRRLCNKIYVIQKKIFNRIVCRFSNVKVPYLNYLYLSLFVFPIFINGFQDGPRSLAWCFVGWADSLWYYRLRFFCAEADSSLSPGERNARRASLLSERGLTMTSVTAVTSNLGSALNTSLSNMGSSLFSSTQLETLGNQM